MYDPTHSPVGSQAIIKIIGIGGCGGNIINNLVSADIEGVEYVYIDVEDEIMSLIASRADSKCPIPNNVVNSLIGKSDTNQLILQHWLDNISTVIEDADMIFIIAGMGGNTGSVIAPVVAILARDRDILTMSYAVTPFKDEGISQHIIERNLDDLYQQTGSLLCIHNQSETIAKVNETIKHSVQDVAELITGQGMIGIDFADVRSVVSIKGKMLTSTAYASGENRAVTAINEAFSSIGINQDKIRKAKGMLVNIRSDATLTIGEYIAISDACDHVSDEYEVVLVGSSFAEKFPKGQMRVTVVLSGINEV